MKNIIAKSAICLLILSAFAGTVFAAKIETNDPIKLIDGQTLKSTYYFAHWWDPWKSDDAAVTSDLQKMKSLGINTVFLDHEVSQALDRDWYWLDREYRLVAQQNMYILPWLQLHCVDRQALMNFSHLELEAAVNQDRNVENDCVSLRDPKFREALVRYIDAYIDRYEKDPAILRISSKDRVYLVVGLMMEMGWRNALGKPLSFDDNTNTYFRKWMKSSYKSLSQLNSKWGTSYKSFDEIDPCDKTIFNYDYEDKENMPAAVKDHMKFRARIIADTFESVAKQVRKRHKNVILAAEIAYPFSLNTKEALTYKWNNANDIMIINSADMVCIRIGDNTAKDQMKKDQEKMILSGKYVLSSYSFSPNAPVEKAPAFGLDGAIGANAIGYYSWNETADRTASIFDRPDQQAMVKTMFDVYDILNDPGKRHTISDQPQPQYAQPAESMPVLPSEEPSSVAEPVITPASPSAPAEATPPVPEAPATPKTETENSAPISAESTPVVTTPPAPAAPSATETPTTSAPAPPTQQ